MSLETKTSIAFWEKKPVPVLFKWINCWNERIAAKKG
nr:MAG TPA: hypothetical protein [Caudoviricetes sp.]DAT53667.1 MAG TPA: hypothetical protein [Caudoviricetes sp.]